MKRKFLNVVSLLAALAISVSFVACGDKGNEDSRGNGSSNSSSIGGDSENENGSDNSSSSSPIVEDEILVGTEGVIYELVANGAYARAIGYEGTETEVVIASRYKGVPVRYIECVAWYNDFTKLVIPDSVTHIGRDAFSMNEELTSVTLGKNVKDIGYGAFSCCTNLTEINIPDSVTSIGEQAFLDCSSLTKVVLPAGVTDIGYVAFGGCSSLAEINIPDSVINIGYNEFYENENLKCNVKDGLKYLGNENNPYVYLVDVATTDITSATVAEGCKFIEAGAFSDCESLEYLSIPNSITNIGSQTSIPYTASKDGLLYLGNQENPYLCLMRLAQADNGLTSINIANGCKVIADRAFERFPRQLSAVTIPDTVTHIGYASFSGSLSADVIDLIIPDSVEYIGGLAFSYGAYTKVVIPDSVQYLGKNAFSSENLMEIIVDENNKAYKSIDGNLYSKDGKNFLQYAMGKTDTAFVVPNGVESVNVDSLFARVSAIQVSPITELTFPDSVISIWCNIAGGAPSNFKKVSGPVAAIRRVYHLGDLESVTVTSGELKEIRLSHSTTYTLSDKVSFIDERWFLSDFLIPTLIVDDNNPYYKTVDGNLYTKDGKTLLLYMDRQATTFTLPDEVTTISEWAFYGTRSPNYFPACLTALTSINIGKNLVSIPEDAFAYCSSLQSITVSEENPVYKSIDGNLCTKDGKTLLRYAVGKETTSVTIPEGVTYIGVGAFAQGTMTEVVIPADVTGIGDRAFEGCTNLVKLVIPNSVTSMGELIFNQMLSWNLTLYCEAQEKPENWAEDWCMMYHYPGREFSATVVWGYLGE